MKIFQMFTKNLKSIRQICRILNLQFKIKNFGCFKQEQEKAVKQFQDLFHTEKTSQDIKKILPAAQQGRVGCLFLDVADQKWGTFSPDKNQVKIEKERKPDLEELIDLSAVKTLSQGGTVYAMNKEEMPVNSSRAAVFCW